MTSHRGKFVAYYRVSTDRQGQSGLGLEAQRSAVLDYLDGGSWTMFAEFTEVESARVSVPPNRLCQHTIPRRRPVLPDKPGDGCVSQGGGRHIQRPGAALEGLAPA
jgi:hypothetical protein